MDSPELTVIVSRTILAWSIQPQFVSRGSFGRHHLGRNNIELKLFDAIRRWNSAEDPNEVVSEIPLGFNSNAACAVPWNECFNLNVYESCPIYIAA